MYKKCVKGEKLFMRFHSYPTYVHIYIYIYTRIPVATLPDYSPPLTLQDVFSYPHIHDDSIFLYTHLILVPLDFSLYAGYNLGCPRSSRLLNFENGYKAKIQNFVFKIIAWSLINISQQIVQNIPHYRFLKLGCHFPKSLSKN